jgi:orotidine-5'-phosphate decarboxylase
MTHFADRLSAAVRNKRTPALVGLDPRRESLPAGMLDAGGQGNAGEIAAAYRTFCAGVIDVVAPLVPAVKPQAAFFEELGPAGPDGRRRSVAATGAISLLKMRSSRLPPPGSFV